MDRYLIYRRNSSTEFEYLGSAHFVETAISFCKSISHSFVILNDSNLFKTIVYEN